MTGIELLISDNWGIYIPKHFAENFLDWSYIKQEDRDILESGPENELYWDAWDSILSNAEYTDSNGYKWHLIQDGDLWAYCNELMTDEEYYGFYGEKRNYD